MTTPVYGIRKWQNGEPLAEVGNIYNQLADTVEAAFVRGGMAVPGAASLADLSAKTLPTVWQAMPLAIGPTAFAAGHVVMYRIENGRVWCKGWAVAGSSGIGGSSQYLSAALPAAYRPAQAREVWPIGTSTNRPYRVIIQPTGLIAAADTTLTAGQFLNFDHATWPLG